MATVYKYFSWNADCVVTSKGTDQDDQDTCRFSRRTPAGKVRQATLRARCARRSRKRYSIGYRNILRQRTFSSPSPPLGDLMTDPEKVLALFRATF